MDVTKLSLYEWLADKQKRGEEVKLTSLLIDIDNAPLLKKSAIKLVEEGISLDIPQEFDIENSAKDRAYIDRLFNYHINHEALQYLIEDKDKMILKVSHAQKLFKELCERSKVDEETQAEAEKEIKNMKEEALAHASQVEFIKQQFENQENVDEYMDSGTVWFKEDKQLVIDILDELEEVKDEKVNNFVTASTLVHRIDTLIGRINLTIEKLEMHLEEEEQEESITIEVEELQGNDKISSTVLESEKPEIEETQLQDLDEHGQPKQEEKVEQATQQDAKNDVEQKETSEELQEIRRTAQEEEEEEVEAISIEIPM